MLQYLLGNLEYDSLISKEGVHYTGKDQKDIIKEDDVEGILTDRLESTSESYLENSLKGLSTHTDVMMEKEKR